MLSDKYIDWIWQPWDKTRTSMFVRMTVPLWFIPWFFLWVVGGTLILLIDVLYCILRWMVRGSDV